MLDFLERLHAAAVKTSEELGFEGLSAQDRAALLYYGNIIEHAGAFRQLAENSYWAGASVVARSCLEAYVHYANVCSDADYLNFVEFKGVHGLIRRLDNAGDPKNLFFSAVRKMPDNEERRNELTTRKQALEEQGYKILTVREGFDRINMLDVYLSVYDVLSNKAHGGIGGLYAKHLLENGDIQFGVYHQEGTKDYAAEIDLVASVLANTHAGIHSRLGTAHAASAENLQNELFEIRAQVAET